MVVGQLHVGSLAVPPLEAEPPPVTDTDAPPPRPVSVQLQCHATARRRIRLMRTQLPPLLPPLRVLAAMHDRDDGDAGLQHYEVNHPGKAAEWRLSDVRECERILFGVSFEGVQRHAGRLKELAPEPRPPFFIPVERLAQVSLRGVSKEKRPHRCSGAALLDLVQDLAPGPAESVLRFQGCPAAPEFRYLIFVGPDGIRR